VIDTAPRGLSDEQAQSLRELAAEVSRQIERRRLDRASGTPRSEP
jgi:GAF domain-containing protein